MPYNLSTEHPECEGIAVVKTEDNKLVGCHETEKEAEAQLTALNIAYEEENESSVDQEKSESISNSQDQQDLMLKSNNMDDKKELRKWNVEGVEQRDSEDGQLVFSGYASVFDYSYPVADSRGSYLEIIKRGAFTKTLQEREDVKLLVNHEGIPLARSKSGTLHLEEDDRGLKVEAKLDPTNPKVAEVASAMKREDLTEMSFAFQSIRDEFNEAGDERQISECKLFDVSIVTTPASAATEAKIRGVDISALEKALVEARNDEPVNEEVLIKVIDQIHDLLPKRKGTNVSLAKRKLEMLDIRSS